MKTFFLFFFLAASQAFSIHKEWEEFKKSFGKEYKDVKEELHRIKIFFENKLLIDEHNKNFEKGLVSFQMRMNHFGDWMHEEFRSIMNRFNSSKTPGKGSSCDDQCEILRSINDAPSSIDWRSKGAVTPVKNQRNCGSCWAFSTTGALEGQNFRKTGKLVSLSEQNLVDCSLKFGNHGCGGGLMDNAFRYVKENGGIDTEESYPYAGVNERCRFDPSHVGATDSGFVDIPRGDENALRNAVATVGPVSVGIDAGRKSFQFYHSGVYSEKHCSSQDLDHGVLVVGYGTENGEDYWLVKNSWSTEWGDEGYIKMSRNNRNNCGIATAASYPIV